MEHLIIYGKALFEGIVITLGIMVAIGFLADFLDADSDEGWDSFVIMCTCIIAFVIIVYPILCIFYPQLLIIFSQ